MIQYTRVAVEMVLNTQKVTSPHQHHFSGVTTTHCDSTHNNTTPKPASNSGNWEKFPKHQMRGGFSSCKIKTGQPPDLDEQPHANEQRQQQH